MSALLDCAGPILMGLGFWLYATTGWLPGNWRFS